MDSNEKVDRAVAVSIGAIVLPVRHPIVQHLPHLNICDRNFFDRINFQTWGVQHFLNCSGGRFENSERYHLVKAQVLNFRGLLDISLHLSQVFHWVLVKI